jgi:hypothetical protein
MVNWINPGQSLTNQTTAAAGTSVDFMGENTGAVATVQPGCPTTIAAVVTVTGWASSYNAALAVAYPYVSVGLEVSLDGTNWIRIASCQVTGNGQFKASGSFPCRFARATLDALDSRVSAITVNAWVAGGT